MLVWIIAYDPQIEQNRGGTANMLVWIVGAANICSLSITDSDLQAEARVTNFVIEAMP